MSSNSVKIVIIHDDVYETTPLLVVLKDKYGDDNVILIQHSQEGLDYVLSNLGQKMVILLDKNFFEGREMSGIKVFEKIREKTALLYIILVTVTRLADFDEDTIKTLINNDLFAFVSFTSDYTEIVKRLDEAVDKLELQVDAVIEEWITKHSEERKNQPLIKTSDGKKYSMNDILLSIRMREKIGIEFEKNLLQLAIEIFSRQKLLS